MGDHLKGPSLPLPTSIRHPSLYARVSINDVAGIIHCMYVLESLPLYKWPAMDVPELTVLARWRDLGVRFSEVAGPFSVSFNIASLSIF